MTFLLFLASLVVLEYLVRDVGRVKQTKLSPPDASRPIDPIPLTAETSTADLLALGQALGSTREPADSEKFREEKARAVENPPLSH